MSNNSDGDEVPGEGELGGEDAGVAGSLREGIAKSHGSGGELDNHGAPELRLVGGAGCLNEEALCMGGSGDHGGEKSRREGVEQPNGGSWAPKYLKILSGEQDGRLRAANNGSWVLGEVLFMGSSGGKREEERVGKGVGGS